MSVASQSKAKPIDKVLKEDLEQNDSGHQAVIVWPPMADGPQSAVQDLDLLGYGEAEPAPRHRRVPRRSSLSNKQSATNRRASIGYTGEMTLTLPNKEKVTKRRSITFSDDDTVHSAESKGYTDDDDEDADPVNTRQLWFQEEEYRHIEHNIRNIVRDTRFATDRPTWLETRGLEGVLDGTVGEERQSVIQSVLEDQQRQKEMGVYDEDMIASSYQFQSMDASLVAADRAKKDEKEVEVYLENTKRIHQIQQRRMSC